MDGGWGGVVRGWREWVGRVGRERCVNSWQKLMNKAKKIYIYVIYILYPSLDGLDGGRAEFTGEQGSLAEVVPHPQVGQVNLLLLLALVAGHLG